MTPPVWTLAWLPALLSVMSELPKPEKLQMISKDFRHILKWRPGQGTPAGASYNVSMATDRDSSWTAVAGCVNVKDQLECNLTDALMERRKKYNLQVTAFLGQQSSAWASLSDFIPIRDTELRMPLLSLTQCGRNLCVDLQPPTPHLREVYDHFSYKLQIQSEDEHVAQVMDIKSLKNQTLEDLAPGRQYCVSVRFADELESRKSNYSRPVCASPASVMKAESWIGAMLCVLVLFPVVVVGFLFSTGFICLKKRPLPHILTSVSHLDEALAECSASASSLVTVSPALPSSGERRRKESSSDESEEESESETSRRSYKLWGGATGPPTSSSSSSSLSAPLSPEPEPQPLLSSDQTAKSAEARSVKDRRSVGAIGQEEVPEDVAFGEDDSPDVNLLTLTFGREEEEEEEQLSQLDVADVHTEALLASQKCSVLSVQPSPAGEARNTETGSCSADEEEEEEEEETGYMGRPGPDVLRTFI